MRCLIYIICSVLMSYIIIGLLIWNFNPYNWTEIWNATWLIITIQFYLFALIDDKFKIIRRM